MFTRSRYEVSVEEMETLGTILLQVTATDADNVSTFKIHKSGSVPHVTFSTYPRHVKLQDVSKLGQSLILE